MAAANPFANLPDEITILCLKRLIWGEDSIRCGAVCKSWQSYLRKLREDKQLNHSVFAPWLMLTPPDDDYTQEQNQKFFSFSKKKLFDVELPNTQGKKCWGSPFGWILTIGIDLNVQLFNPLSRTQLSLPSQTTFEPQFPLGTPPADLRQSFIQKLVLSSNPSHFPSSRVQVMAIYGSDGDLAYAYPGDEIWIPVQRTGYMCHDVVFFKDQFYAVTGIGQVVVCNTTDPSRPYATHFADPPEGSEDAQHFYLVEMFGHLHIIERNYTALNPSPRRLIYNTDYFLVHQLDFNTKSWITLEDLDDYAIFIGNNTSFAVSTSVYPELKFNSIYFSDDHIELLGQPTCDMGVYNYEDDTVETNIYVGNDTPTEYTRPFFFIPSF